LWRHTIRKTE